MAEPDVDLNLDDLRVMSTNLGTFVTEFENIDDTTDDVEGAVGRPAGDSRLRSKVNDFEEGWNGNREVILESLKNVHEHIKAIVDGFSETDTKMAGDGS
ncbi:flagellar protein FlgN [Microbacterium sulfonylureivorans]|uniref:flagellar protein FlgN n=1 Tax=Microbacterium sulfonylureivorans TaxID=2486854 RepID=UPI000FD9EB24|nr:flagellar protein FlgN [Microbacterium sulfonylureivorans]